MAARSRCSPSVAPQLSRRRDGMGRDGGALAAGERPDPANEPRVGWSWLLAALAGSEPAGVGIAAQLPPAGSGERGGAAPRCLPPAGHAVGRASPPARSCPPRHQGFRGNPLLRGKSSIAGGPRRRGVKFPGPWCSAQRCRDPVYLHRPGPS